MISGILQSGYSVFYLLAALLYGFGFNDLGWRGMHRLMEELSDLAATNGVNVTTGVTFTPYMDYICHPDQLALAKPSANLDHAVQVGTLLSMNFNQILGLTTLDRVR